MIVLMMIIGKKVIFLNDPTLISHIAMAMLSKLKIVKVLVNIISLIDFECWWWDWLMNPEATRASTSRLDNPLDKVTRRLLSREKGSTSESVEDMGESGASDNSESESIKGRNSGWLGSIGFCFAIVVSPFL